MKKTWKSLEHLSETELKSYYLHGAKALPFGVVNRNSQNGYTMGKGKKDSQYATVLRDLEANGPSKKIETLVRAFGIDEEAAVRRHENWIATCKARHPDWNWVHLEKGHPLRGQNCCVYSALHQGKLISYSAKTRKWDLTELGRWYIREVLNK